MTSQIGHGRGPRHRPRRRPALPSVVPLVVALALSVVWQVGHGAQAEAVAVTASAGGATGPLRAGVTLAGVATAAVPARPEPIAPQPFLLPDGAATGTTGTAGSARTGSAAAAPSPEDRLAGLRSHVVRRAGSGHLAVVPGSARAPGRGRVVRVRVEVETGLPVDGAAFAAFVMSTLNDSRSWGSGGRLTFGRTSRDPDVRVVLASPDTSERMCGRLQTRGVLSCGTAGHAVLTFYRWVRGTSDYRGDLTSYRRYLVNHEVGHLLGHGHETCPGRGRRAPVMQQQTKGLRGCTKNSWPYP